MSHELDQLRVEITQLREAIIVLKSALSQAQIHTAVTHNLTLALAHLSGQPDALRQVFQQISTQTEDRALFTQWSEADVEELKTHRERVDKQLPKAFP